MIQPVEKYFENAFLNIRSAIIVANKKVALSALGDETTNNWNKKRREK
jgi:hypothetical protein